MKYLLTILLVLSPLAAQAADPAVPGKPPEPVRNVTATLISTTAGNPPVSPGQPSFSQEMPGSAQSPANTDIQDSGRDAEENASEPTSGSDIKADTVIDIGEDGSTLQIVDGGVKLPGNMTNQDEE